MLKNNSTLLFIIFGLIFATAAYLTALVNIPTVQTLLNEPLPPPALPQETIPFIPIEKLGQLILYDHTLSDPPGYSCASCHVPETGFTGSSSFANEFSGPQRGVRPNRFSDRKPQSYLYAAYSPVGPFYNHSKSVWMGGNFWDGRVADLASQALQPPLNPNEMANTPIGPYPPLVGGYSPLIVQKLQNRPYTPLFKEVFGQNVFETKTAKQIYDLFGEALAAYQASGELCSFSSKYDASKYGTPKMNLYTLSESEERGRQLYFDKAQCFQCHSSAQVPFITDAVDGKETFTMYCYANIGVPKNPENPFYRQVDKESNPHGYNRHGTKYIDYGLGANPNPAPDGTRFYNKEPGDIEQFRGLFKAPSMRGVDKRPTPDFVKAYMHNGVFKSLKEVVHFYNKRNIAINMDGKEVVFDLRKGPPAGYTPLFDPPEVIDNVQNVMGMSPLQATSAVESNGQVGNLQLTEQEENDLINFLKILSDGYSKPNPVSKKGQSGYLRIYPPTKKAGS